MGWDQGLTANSHAVSMVEVDGRVVAQDHGDIGEESGQDVVMV